MCPFRALKRQIAIRRYAEACQYWFNSGAVSGYAKSFEMLHVGMADGSAGFSFLQKHLFRALPRLTLWQGQLSQAADSSVEGLRA